MRKPAAVRCGIGTAWLTLLLITAACNRATPDAAPSRSPERPPGQFGPAHFPMPRAEFNERLSAPLLDTCRNAETEYYLSRSACLALITQRLERCLAAARAPAVIDSLEQFTALGRPTLECAKPYPFCKGIEVRDTQQAMKLCSPAQLPLPPR